MAGRRRKVSTSLADAVPGCGCRAGSLVEQDNARAAHQRPGNKQPLPLEGDPVRVEGAPPQTAVRITYKTMDGTPAGYAELLRGSSRRLREVCPCRSTDRRPRLNG